MKFRAAVTTIALVLTVTAMAFAAGSGAHFKSASASFCSNNDLCLTFDEVGVGSSTISYSVTATVNATYCPTTTSSSGSFNEASSKNNVAVSNVDTGIKAAASATTNLWKVGYSNIQITDTNNSVSTTTSNLAQKTVGSCP